MIKNISAIIFLINIVLNASYCLAFDDKKTHPTITEYTTKISSFGPSLNILGFNKGVESIIAGYTIGSWLNKGSTKEDDPVCRAANHFHNPVHTGDWTQSQSTDVWPQDAICQLLGWTPRYSNITWATGLKSPNDTTYPRDKRTLQNMGYDNARLYLYDALTSSDTTTRETLFAKSFQAVGQTLHLLQDMAVPAHVRNDFLSHLIYSEITLKNILNPPDWVANPFEAYVRKNPSLITSIPPSQIYPPSITGAKISDFWDTDRRPGSPILQGLAESTNAGYFSDFTIPGNPHIPFVQAHTFPLPQLVPTYTCVDKVPGSIRKRKYASRFPCPAAGGVVDHFAAISSITPRLLGLPLPPINKYALDDNVHNTYAKELLPRAVGFSSALLDYFYRGNIKVSTVNPSDISFRSVKVNVQNNTPDETMGVGEVKLIIRYKALSEWNMGGNKYQLNNPPVEDTYAYKVSIPQYVDLTNPQTLTFDFSTDTLPYFFDDMTMQLVFKGKLGNEEGAVAVSELKPIDGVYTDFTVTLPASGVFAKATDNTLGATFNELRVKAQTDISAGLTGGSFELALEYRKAITDPFQSLPVDSEPANAAAYVIRVPEKNGVSILQPGTPVELVFDLSSVLLPVSATDVYLNIIYKNAGTSKTMAVGYRDISEPTPVDVFNNADKVCINKQWYNAGSPEAIALVNVNVFDPYAHDIANIFTKESSSFNATTASATNFTFQSPALLTGGAFRRLGYILTDYDFKYSFTEDWINVSPALDPWDSTGIGGILPGAAARNQTDADGMYTYSTMFTMRGNKMWWGASIIFVNTDDEDSECGWNKL